MKSFVATEMAPAALGCYSQAVVADNTLYLSGQIGLDPSTGQMMSDTFEGQLNQIFTNIASVLQAAETDLNQVIKLTVYLKNFAEDYAKLDDVMQSFFEAPFPARTTIGVSALPRNALVEVDAIAVIE